MKILLGWILFTSLLSIAIVFKAPDFLPVGEKSSVMISQSSQIELLEELMNQETIDRNLLQEKYSELKQNDKSDAAGAQLESLSITSLLFALVGLNKLNIILIAIYWFATRKKKGL